MLAEAVFEQAMSPSNFSVPQFMAALVSQNVLTWAVAMLRGDRGKRRSPSPPTADVNSCVVSSWIAQANVLATHVRTLSTTFHKFAVSSWLGVV